MTMFGAAIRRSGQTRWPAAIADQFPLPRDRTDAIPGKAKGYVARPGWSALRASRPSPGMQWTTDNEFTQSRIL